LAELKENVQKRINSFVEKQRAIHDEIQRIVDDESMKKTKYVLYSVWIHGGSAESGHYFVYVRDFETDTWYEMNDVQIRKSSLEVAMTQGIGNRDASQSASFLVYVSQDYAEANRTTPTMALTDSQKSYVEMVDKNPGILDSYAPQLTDEQKKFIFTAPKVSREFVSEYLLKVKDNSAKIPFLKDFCLNCVNDLTRTSSPSVIADSRFRFWRMFLRSIHSDESERLLVSVILRDEYDSLVRKQPGQPRLPREYLGPAFESINPLMKIDKRLDEEFRRMWTHFSNIARIIIAFLRQVEAERCQLQQVALILHLISSETKKYPINFFANHIRLMVDLVFMLILIYPSAVDDIVTGALAAVVNLNTDPVAKNIIDILKDHRKTVKVASLLEVATPGNVPTLKVFPENYGTAGLTKEEWIQYKDLWLRVYERYSDELGKAKKYSEDLDRFAVQCRTKVEERRQEEYSQDSNWPDLSGFKWYGI